MFEPSAQAKTILDRNASAWVDLARRAQRCSWSRSASVNASPAFGRPGRGIPQTTNYSTNFRRDTLVHFELSAPTEVPR